MRGEFLEKCVGRDGKVTEAQKWDAINDAEKKFDLDNYERKKSKKIEEEAK